jgi:hypothetical protein
MKKFKSKPTATKRIVLSLTAFFVGLLSGLAQPLASSEVYHVVQTNDKPSRLIAAQDGGFWEVGTTSDKRGYLTKRSSCGQPLWTKTYLKGTGTTFSAAVELPSGEIYAVGQCDNCAAGDSTSKALVLKIAPDGQLLKDTTLGLPLFAATAGDVIATSTGNIAVALTAQRGIFLKPTDAVLAVLNPTLKTLSWKQLHHLNYDTVSALTKTPDDGFVLCGASYQPPLGPRQAHIFRTDANGNLLWKYISDHLNSLFNDVTITEDGRIVAAGYRHMNDSVKIGYLAVLDGNTGQLLAEKTIESASTLVRSIEKLDNGYLLGGQTGSKLWVVLLNELFEIAEEFYDAHWQDDVSMTNALPLSPNGRSWAFVAKGMVFSIKHTVFLRNIRPGHRIHLTEAPADRQLLPRSLVTNSATAFIKGRLPSPYPYDSLELYLWRDGTLQTVQKKPVHSDLVEFGADIPAELAEYTLQLYGIKNQRRYLETEACDIVAGDAYLIQGQSNAVAGIPLLDPTAEHAYRYHTSPFIRNFGLLSKDDTLYTWRKEQAPLFYRYADNHIGQWGLVLAKSIVDQYGVPVAILNGGIGGISIDSMMLHPNDPTDVSKPYGRFLKRVKTSGLLPHLRAIFMFQGETNAGGAYWDSADKYYNKFVALDQAWRRDFPSLSHRYLFQIRPGAYWIGATRETCLQIAEAQRRIAETIPNWQIMSTTGMNHDSTHFYYRNGYERAGNDLFRLVAHDLYGAPPVANMYPPTVEEAWFPTCDSTRIYLVMRHASDTYFWTPNWEDDFILENSPNTQVIGGEVQGHRIVLHLNQSPGKSFRGLSYASHPGGSEAPVKNANGIGMLMFFRFPVKAAPPLALSDTIVVADKGQNDGAISVAATGGFPPYHYRWSNGQSGPNLQNLGAGTYTLTLSDAAGCIQTFVIEVPRTVSAQQPGDDQVGGFPFFPNPFSSHLQVTPPANSDCLLRITDALGREMFSARITASDAPFYINTHNWPANLYIAYVQIGSVTVSCHRLVKP